MTHSLLIFIAAVFLLAGFVKGVIGLGLPTVSMGLLAAAMPPAHALAIVIVPGILTNIWQTFAGPLFPRHRAAALAAAGGTGRSASGSMPT